MSFFDKFNEISVYYNLMYFRYHMIWTCSLSLFCERSLRFLQAKILNFFLWLSAKKLKRQSISCVRSRTSNYTFQSSYKNSTFIV